ncbi:MAG: hypothetical protein PF447_14925 [Spirochaetaceae bacterium]|jgi:hypothetical protein|nr:hypothetical protein [Spirochaetaceae bacterium]
MYTATMEYIFNEKDEVEISNLWKDQVLVEAEKQPGFIRTFWLVQPGKAMAIGCWEKEIDAKNFMLTGVFKKLIKEIQPYLLENPEPRVWDLKSFSQG